MQLTKHWSGQLEDYVIDLQWSADGAWLAAASASGPVAVYAASGESRNDLPGHDGGTNAVAWAWGQPLLASGGQDGAVRIWDAPNGRHVGTAPGGAAWVEHLAWRPGPGSPILAAAAGRRLQYLNPDATVRHAFADAPKTLTALAWEPSGRCAAVGYFGGVCLWGADPPAAEREFAYGNGILALCWSPDGRWLVSGNQDPSVHLWLPADGTELQMSGYETKVRHLSFDASGRWLATSGSADACVWDCSGPGPEGREPLMLPHPAPVGAVAFQRVHGILASAADDGTVALWSPDRRQPLRATVKLPVAASRLAWSPDDSVLAIGTGAGIVYTLRCVP